MAGSVLDQPGISHGLAGIRVGYGVASDAVARAMRKAQLPFSVSMVAEAAAIAAVRRRDLVEHRAAEVRAERERVRGTLRGLGLDVPIAHGNYLFVPGEEGVTLVAACAAADVAVRPVGALGARISIGTHEENERLLAVAAAVSSRFESTSA